MWIRYKKSWRYIRDSKTQGVIRKSTNQSNVHRDGTLMSYPDNNPKTLVGSKKIPLHLIPPSAKHFLALALEDGGKKYGPYNWRDEPISVSTYYSAGQRHWDAFWDGEDLAQDSKIHHLAHAMACCALLLDAMTVGKLVDDRPTKGAASKLQMKYYNNKEVTPIGDKDTGQTGFTEIHREHFNQLGGFEYGSDEHIRRLGERD